MPDISQWKLSKLQEHEEQYYELLDKWNGLYDGLKPLIEEVIRNLDDETIAELKERMER